MQSTLDEAKEKVRQLRSIYRLAVGEDGQALSDILHEMADQRMSELIESVRAEETQILKGQVRGIRDVIALFANISDLVGEAEAEVRELEMDLSGIPVA